MKFEISSLEIADSMVGDGAAENLCIFLDALAIIVIRKYATQSASFEERDVFIQRMKGMDVSPAAKILVDKLSRKLKARPPS